MTTPPPLLTAALADRYRLERELGQGGMATVYLAQDLKHDRHVALKVLHPEIASALGPERFLREIKLAARLQHPHILTVHDSGEAAGQLWFTMPFVEGESLRERLTREKQLPVEDALRIAREVAEALDYAHRQGVVHRDVKPENILLTGGHALVADFGIARALGGSEQSLTGTGIAIGTPAYMSPEQATGERQLDGRSDVYSLGCVLYEMLVGAPPFAGPSGQALIAQHAIDPVPPLRTRRTTVPSDVELAVLKALAKVPTDRFATALQFSAALAVDHAIDVPKSMRRVSRWRPIAVGITLVLGLATISAVLWRQSTPARPLDADLVMVAPFRVTGADSSLSYLREGLLDLLAAKLTGSGGPRAADPRSVLSAWRRAAGSGPGDLSDPRRQLVSVHATEDGFFCGPSTVFEQLNFQLLFTPADPIHELIKGEPFVKVYGPASLDDFFTDPCDFIANGPKLAEGTARLMYVDNNLTVTPPGANAFGFQSNGTLQRLGRAEKVNFQLNQQFLIGPNGSFFRVLVQDVKLTP